MRGRRSVPPPESRTIADHPFADGLPAACQPASGRAGRARGKTRHWRICYVAGCQCRRWFKAVQNRVLAFQPCRGHDQCMTASSPIRLPWPPDFPDVVIHTDVRTRDRHPGYTAAKAGDAEAALMLASDLLSAGGIASLRDIIGNQPTLLLPVVADELTGFNAIPDAMAQVLGNELGLPVVAGEIVQTNKVGHTRAPAFQRLVTPATFEGQVQAGANYVLVDDHVGLGGTLANLRGYVEAGDGNVIAITTLTESRDARVISLQPETRNVLWGRHGQALDDLWKSQFGYGIDCLTEVEALNLCRQQSVAGIEDFLAQAAVEARGRGLQTAVGPGD